MEGSTEDWRVRGQGRYLQGAVLHKKRYRAWTEKWEHDHCEFCWAKFMEPDFSPSHASFVNEHPDEVLTVGYGVQGRSPKGGTKDDYWWVCPSCVRDLRDQFAWTVIDEDSPPDARSASQP